MYRPQFSNPQPPVGTYDEDFVYSFDPYNTPALNVRFGPGQQLLRIPLQMQSDAAFIHRGLKMNPSFTSFLGVQLFTPDDSPLSDDILPLSTYSANTGNPAPILEPEILSPAGASYQLNVTNRSTTQSALALLGTLSPVTVDPAGTSEGLLTAGNNVPSANAYGPQVLNGALYMILNSAALTTQVWRSADGGQTWQVQDALNSPASNAAATFDGAHSFIVAYVDTGSGDINLINFDVNANTWGVPYATAGAPSSANPWSVSLRPDGDIVVLQNPGTGTHLTASVFSAGAWVAPFEAGTGITTLPGYVAADDVVDWTASVVNPATGDILVFFRTGGDVGPPNWNGRIFFQLIKNDNSLGTFFDFPGNDTTPTKIVSVYSTNPVIAGNSVLLGITEYDAALGINFQSMLIGTGLTAPTFVYMDAPGIDPDAFNSNPASMPGTDFSNAPYLFFDGQTIFALSINQNGDTSAENSQLRIAFTNTPATPSLGWAAVGVFDYTNLGPPFNVPSQALVRASLNVVGNSIYVSSEGQSPAATDERYFMGALTIEPIRIQLRGVKRYVRTKRTQACATNK